MKPDVNAIRIKAVCFSNCKLTSDAIKNGALTETIQQVGSVMLYKHPLMYRSLWDAYVNIIGEH